MWQEARKQEKKLRGILIDYKKRAERRQAYYTKMRMDPHQLMRLHGQKCKFHMLGENALSTNVDGQLVPWQGDANIMIDRFDVRANLDYIPENNSETKERNPEDENFERKCSYERYRTLVQIDATGAPEETYLKQLETEEAFGKKQAEKAQLERQKKASRAKAKIHYKYDESTAVSGDEENDDDGSDESDGELSDIDINVNVMELTEEQTNQMDALATRFGIGYGQYCKQLLLEKKEFEYVKLLEAEEEERSKMPGRKGKSARRCLRIKQKTMRGSPLSFAVQEKSPSQDRDGDSSSSSSSRSTSPVVEEKIEFITEFGGDTKVEDKTPKVKSTSRKKDDSRSRHSSRRSRSRSRSKSRRSRHRKSQSRDRYKSRSRSNDRHRRSRYSRSRSRDRSSRHARSRSRDRYSRHSRSAHRSRTHSSSHSRSSSHGRSNSRKHSWSSSRGDRSRTNSPKRRRPRSRSTERRLKEQTRDRSKSKSKSPEKVNSETKTRSPSKSRSRSHSRSPHRSITKRLSADKVKPIDKSKLTPREKMKLRMQKMLNKQIKVDKVEEKKKQLARDQELEERDIQIYEMSRMMRLRDQESRRRSPSPKGRMPSYDATNFRYKSRSRSPS